MMNRQERTIVVPPIISRVVKDSPSKMIEAPVTRTGVKRWRLEPFATEICLNPCVMVIWLMLTNKAAPIKKNQPLREGIDIWSREPGRQMMAPNRH